MLFFALFFVFANVYALIKGRLFYDVLLESANNEIKKAKGEIKEYPNETKGKLAFIGVYFTFYFIIELIFIYNSLKIDPYLYPTLSIMSFFFITFIINSTKKNNKDLTTEAGQTKYLIKTAKRYTFISLVTKLIFITYFGYMFATLLHLIK